MQWIKVNGNVLRYDLSSDNGPTLVLIHEMGGTLESWDAICSGLGDRFRILRYDVRGSGLSEKIVGETTIDEQVDDLHGLLTSLHIEAPIALAGVAVGAAIAIRFAARYPLLVSHLIGFSPACGVAPSAREATLARATALRYEGLRGLIPQLLDKTWPAPLRSNAQAFESFSNRWLSADPQSFAAIFSMLARMELDDDIPRLPSRTVLIAGEYDGLRPPSEIARLAALASHVEAVHVASGHFMPVQSPLWVMTLLEQTILDNRSGCDIYDEFISQPQHRVSPSGHAA
ncbi:alpha/beta fold hydrolase [Pseudomonas bohemica]|uniref:alpha/beta fold hydrolase n=1 Tax=Pseudomonas bohemica TaxID=2044872 RepID=UPI000DA5F815|nr:alpha/beta fold hydrolase [Pseudomonas bohemica]